MIHNPTAGRRRRRHLESVVAAAQALGATVTCRETGRRGDAEDFAALASADDFDAVIAAGGDGTVNEVLNGLGAGQGGLALGVIPLGTANVLACEIGLDPDDVDSVARTVTFGPARRIHVGLANRRRFLLMAGAGLDAHVVAGVSTALKRRAGKLAYVVESLRQAVGYDFPKLTVRADGVEYEARMVVACKGRFYGGPFIAAPDADLATPMLELCILPNTGVAGMLRYGIALPLGKLPALPEVQVVSARNILITGPRGAPVQGDGDIVARLPAEISIADETVDLICP
ncbi:Sphingosine kinase and enzyme related to eukaryotic diacylglycerol kinase [Paramagnetospirillum magneticum AMB-1]|uniref:Sphingosine kinase and enzyme related to eukaryotic diacylglycerol kinase n=1 Tax=Paramagnetospirillum magneticum (strain ATCC 700264 / AMB-1) TaxID=342108 RepID=Q2WAQ4_PARM1|nr:Sphingosine kinase and enzyme related to eukaryotic diacylglycerol kinase [Paramagnetospirillum magneticum AMB-1]